jgi:small subunit ribosomal protein S5
MSEEIINTNTNTVPATSVAPANNTPKAVNDFRSKNPRRTNFRKSRVKSEFEQKILNIRRVARVATGGRRFSFSVTLVAGDKKGRVGVGIGKANDTSLAMGKAFCNAKKNMVTLNLNKKSSIPHEVGAKYCSARVAIRPAPGRGVVAGSAVRNVLDLAGIKDVTAKIISGSKNKLNIARATVCALSKLPKVKMKEDKKEVSKKEDIATV